MPWITPSLADLRKLNRDSIAAKLGSNPLVPNSALRVLSDADAGMAHLTLKYIDWLAKQMLPDTAEDEFLRRHADIWLPGGAKAATYAEGTINATGDEGADVPLASQLSITIGSTVVQFETKADEVIGPGATTIPIRALTAGKVGNLEPATVINFSTALSGVDGSATVVALAGGADDETTDALRSRVLFRIQNPPMGGDADDYVQWALQVPRVTRAWTAPNEMGIGTVTVRFMTDTLAGGGVLPGGGIAPVIGTNGFPTGDDIEAVTDYLVARRPVGMRDFFVAAPAPEPISFTISDLFGDDAAIRANIAESVRRMLYDRGRPSYARNGVKQDAQTIYRAWVSEAISQATGVEYFDLTMTDHVMPTNGSMATLGTITYV